MYIVHVKSDKVLVIMYNYVKKSKSQEVKPRRARLAVTPLNSCFRFETFKGRYLHEYRF